MKLRVLVACEFTGTVREQFRKLGHDAWSCDLLPTEVLGNHYQCDVRKVLREGWDLMIAHPPCTYLAIAGNAWMNHPKYPNRHRDRAAAIKFVDLLWNAPIPHIAIENPIGVLGKMWRPHTQIIQPYQFGDPSRKATCLWLKHLPQLKPTKIVEPELVYTSNGKSYSAHEMRLNQWNPNRALDRSRTFLGIARAMANQWGKPRH